MANSHVQGLSLRTQVHVMTPVRSKSGINTGLCASFIRSDHL